MAQGERINRTAGRSTFNLKVYSGVRSDGKEVGEGTQGGVIAREKSERQKLTILARKGCLLADLISQLLSQGEAARLGED